MKHINFSNDELFEFVNLAGKSTYASGMPPLTKSERKDFIEYKFDKGKWSYLDSYTGHTKSAGQEVVRYNDEIVWTNSYCGGMTPGNESMANQTFSFLKKALSVDDKSAQSLRGPKEHADGDWEYRYTQKGEITNFSGYEEILFKNKIIFFHRTIGGTVINT